MKVLLAVWGGGGGGVCEDVQSGKDDILEVCVTCFRLDLCH